MDLYIWLPSLVDACSILCMLYQDLLLEVQHRLHSEHDKDILLWFDHVVQCSPVE